MEPKADGAGDGEPNAEVAGFAPKALAPEAGADGVEVVDAGDSLAAPAGTSAGLALSLLASAAEPKPKPVEPNADAGLPLPAAPLKAPKPKLLPGLDAAPKAGDEVDDVEGEPKADD